MEKVDKVESLQEIIAEISDLYRVGRVAAGRKPCNLAMPLERTVLLLWDAIRSYLFRSTHQSILRLARHHMAMAFRDHPLMTRRSGMKTWPPLWTSTGQDKRDWPKGDAGTLREAWLHDGLDTCLFLFMEHRGHRYVGSMYFDDIGFCYDIDRVLKSNLGRSIKEIGDLDLAYLL
jgi:hypothetical protein